MATTYAAWVREHPDQAQHVEDVVRLVAMLAPSHMGEAAYALTNVLTTVHDFMRMPEGMATRAPVRTFLTLLATCDTVVELVARGAGGQRWKWRAIVLIEAVRAAARLYMLAAATSTRQPALLHHGGQWDRGDMAAAGTSASTTLGVPTPTTPSSPAAPSMAGAPSSPATRWWRGGASGITLPMTSLPPPPSALTATAAGLSKGSGAATTAPATPHRAGDVALGGGGTMTSPDTPTSPNWSQLVASCTMGASMLAQHVRAAVVDVLACDDTATATRKVGQPTPTTVARAGLAAAWHAVGAWSSPAAPTATGAGGGEPGGSYCDVTEGAPLHAVAEVAFIVRPLAYAWLRMMLGGQSWVPSLLSLAVDVVSHRCHTVAYDRASGGSEGVVPLPAITAAAVTHRAVRAGVSQLMRTIFPGVPPTPGPHDGAAGSVVASDEAHMLKVGVRGFAFDNPPGGTPDAAVVAVLNHPSLSPWAAILRFGLWLLTPHAGMGDGPDMEELSRRRMLWALYLLRGRPYHSITSPALRSMTWIPLLGSLISYLHAITAYLNAHHFYVSGSQ